MKAPFLLITALSVLLIAALAGGTLLVLRRMHDRAAAETAAETVIQRGQTLVAHLISQVPETDNETGEDWSGWSQFVRYLNAVKHGLQYVSVSRNGMVVFHEQTVPPEAPGGSETMATLSSSPDIVMRRALLQSGHERVPVVVFSATIESGQESLNVEVALRKETVSREARAAGTAISSMFRLSLLTVCVAFGVCAVLVVLMIRREWRHEALRAEQEHLAFSGMLANGIVHDFRNPMSSLKLDAQMLEREVERADQARPKRIAVLSARLRHTLDRMDEVFKAFLYVSRPDTAERTGMDIATCLHDALATLASRLERNHLRTEIRVPEQPLNVLVFVASLRRALVNVLTNAIDFSPACGLISIRITRDGGNAVIEISDQGPGIPIAERRRVFDMFVTTRPEGTGLGLFLAKTAVERSGGTIEIIDQAQTPGTCLRITLSLA